MIGRLRVKWFKRRIQRRLRAEAAHRAASHEPIRLVIGAAAPLPYVGPPGSSFAGWLCTSVSTLDALEANDWRNIFRPASVSTILAEHVIEHWTMDQFGSFLGIARSFLSPGGFIRIAVPDGLHPDAAYIESVKPGGIGPGADDHRVLYNYQTLSRLVSDKGFQCNLLEYFDEEGQFHPSAWNAEAGFVERSEQHDPRNQERPLAYTSLIVDCIRLHTT